MEKLHSTLALCYLLIFTFDCVTPSPTPDASLLCISECGTCPVICSPPPSTESKPPPSSETKPPPSPVSKPPRSVGSEPPPYLTPIYHPTPPIQSYSPPTPTPTPTSSTPHPRAPKSCPPPSYITTGTNAPPPPPPKLVVVPAGGGVGQQNPSSVPYYYFYTSKGGVACSHGFLILFTCLYFIFLFIG